MNIKGVHKTSLIDYPGKISAVIFTGGCNLRCGFCHNEMLVLDSPELSLIPEEEVLALLKQRKNLLDAVTVSGGEPSLCDGLIPFLRKVKAIGLSVKLDTNGYSPETIQKVLNEKLADYIALDIKTSPDKYSKVTCADVTFKPVMESYNIIKNSGVDYELRMTAIPGFSDEDDIRQIGEVLGEVKRFYLQQFINHLAMNPQFASIHPYSIPRLSELKNEVMKFALFCEIRGI